jgi:hypothetical protein
MMVEAEAVLRGACVRVLGTRPREIKGHSGRCVEMCLSCQFHHPLCPRVKSPGIGVY